MVADCKSAGLTPYVGSNPTPTMDAGQQAAGRRGRVADGRVRELEDTIGCGHTAPMPVGPAETRV